MVNSIPPAVANAYRPAMPAQSVVRAVLADLLEAQANDPDIETLAAASFNDDAWYEYDTHSLKLVRVHSPEAFRWSPAGVPAPAGRKIVSGLKAKRLGLWWYRAGV